MEREPWKGLWGTARKAVSPDGTPMAPGHQSRGSLLRNREGTGAAVLTG